MPRVKLAEIVDSDSEDSGNSLGTDSSVDDVPQEYAIEFSESVPQPWVKPSDKRAIFVDPPMIKKPFLDPPSSGSLLGMDKTMTPGFDSLDCRVLGEFVEKPSYQVGPSLLRSRLKCQEFSWTSFKSEAATHVNKVWQKWVFTVLFEEDGDFVRRLKFAGVAEAIRTSAGLGVQRNGYDMSLLWQRWCSQTHTFLTSWGEFSPTLEDVVVLLQLPVFGSVDLTLFRPDSDMLKLARHLQTNLSDAGRYAKELSKSRHIKKSSSKDEHLKTRGPSKGKEMVGDKQDSKKKKITVKYSYSNWSRYFFGDFLNGEFVPAPAVPSNLREAAFVAYWLSKYVFLGLADECMSHGVFLLACLIAGGERLPLASLYLGSLYTRLDQFSQQLKIAHGHNANKCNRSMINKEYQTVNSLKEIQVTSFAIFESLLNFISGSTQSKRGGWSLVSKLMNNKRMLSNTEDNNEFAKVDDALQFFAFNMGNIDDLQNKLLRLGSCIQDLEEGLDSLFRRLIKIRIVLLNILNH
ncbi:hypothetical protein AHAS_Ahas13G0071900 [Arachis hypogaea]